MADDPKNEGPAESGKAPFGMTAIEEPPEASVETGSPSVEESQSEEAATDEAAAATEISQPEQELLALVPAKYRADTLKLSIKNTIEGLKAAEAQLHEGHPEVKELKEKIKGFEELLANLPAAQEAEVKTIFDELDTDEKWFEALSSSGRKITLQAIEDFFHTKKGREVFRELALERDRQLAQDYTKRQREAETAQRQAGEHQVKYLREHYGKSVDLGPNSPVWDGIAKELRADQTITMETALHRVLGIRKPPPEATVLGGSERKPAPPPKKTAQDSFLDAVYGQPGRKRGAFGLH